MPLVFHGSSCMTIIKVCSCLYSQFLTDTTSDTEMPGRRRVWTCPTTVQLCGFHIVFSKLSSTWGIILNVSRFRNCSAESSLLYLQQRVCRFQLFHSLCECNTWVICCHCECSPINLQLQPSSRTCHCCDFVSLRWLSCYYVLTFGFVS